MSKLEGYGRELVEFNPENTQHRIWYANFVKQKTWKECPVRFKLKDNFVNVIAMIQSQITEYYLSADKTITQ